MVVTHTQQKIKVKCHSVRKIEWKQADRQTVGKKDSEQFKCDIYIYISRTFN